MSYTPTTWTTGDTITASAMNKIENGIANAGNAMIVTGSYVNGNYTLDKTIQELYEATLAGIPVYHVYTYGTWGTNAWTENNLCYMYTVFQYNSSTYRVAFTRMIGVSGDYYPKLGSAVFGASSTDSYPIWLGTIEYAVD
jgi:hypothetical protein